MLLVCEDCNSTSRFQGMGRHLCVIRVAVLLFPFPIPNPPSLFPLLLFTATGRHGWRISIKGLRQKHEHRHVS